MEGCEQSRIVPNLTLWPHIRLAMEERPHIKLVTALTLAALGAASLQAGLVHHYDFTTSVTDLVGSANGTLNGGAAVEGGVLTIDGEPGSYAQFNSHIIPVTGDSTVSLDFQSLGAQSGTIELISQGFTTRGYFIGSNAGGDFRATDQWILTGINFPTDSAWHKVALVSNLGAQTLTLYLDGAMAGSTTLVFTSGGSDTRLGAQFDCIFQDSENFLGNIDNDNALIHQEPTELTAAPEPSEFVLLGLGGVTLSGMRRRR